MIDAILGLEGQVQRAVIAALLVALALAIIAGGAGTLYYRAEAADARAKAARCAGDLAVEKANVGRLEDAVAVQNRAVDAIQVEADKRVALSEEARKRAEAEARKHRAAADGIMAAKPDDATDLCGSALRLFNRGRP